MPTARLNGIDIHYDVTGDGPQTLVLVHNVIANMSAYDDNAPVFGQHYRTIRFDLRGHGRSSKADTQAQAPGFYTFENTAADLAALLDHLGVERCHVLGQAYWGVSTASTFMAKHPERVQSLTAVSCDLLATPDGQGLFDRLTPELRAGFERLHDVARREGMLAVFEARKQTRTFWGERLMASPAILERFRQMYAETSPLTFLNFPLLRPAAKQAICDTLARHRIPTLVLMGVQDPHPEQMIAHWKADYPDCHALLLPDCGHYVAIENPADFNRAVLNFLAGVRLYGGAG